MRWQTQTQTLTVTRRPPAAFEAFTVLLPVLTETSSLSSARLLVVVTAQCCMSILSMSFVLLELLDCVHGLKVIWKDDEHEEQEQHICRLVSLSIKKCLSQSFRVFVKCEIVKSVRSNTIRSTPWNLPLDGCGTIPTYIVMTAASLGSLSCF
jgi:hypothetical protein